MFRMVLAFAGLLTSTAALGQTAGGPPIAYVTGSTKGDAIYLVYPDGTGLTKVYTAPRQGRFGSRVDRVSLKPSGDQIAFVLDNTRLMLQNHSSSGQPVGEAFEVDVPNGSCALHDPDYRSDGSLVVSDGCQKVWLVAPDASSATTATEWFSGNIGALAARGTDLVYFETQSASSGELKLRSATGTSVITATSFVFPLHLDAIGNTAVLSGGSSYRTVDLTTGAIANGCTAGGTVKYSPDGSQMLYVYRNTLLVRYSNCNNAPLRLTRGVKSAAWRSD